MCLLVECALRSIVTLKLLTCVLNTESTAMARARKFRYIVKRPAYTKREMEWLVTKTNRKAKSIAVAHEYRAEGYAMGMADSFKLFIKHTRTFDFLLVDFLLKNGAWPDSESERLLQLALDKGMDDAIDYSHVLNENWGVRKVDLKAFVDMVKAGYDTMRLFALSRSLQDQGINLTDQLHRYVSASSRDTLPALQADSAKS